MDIAEIRKRAKQLRFMEGDEVEGRGGVTPPLQQSEEAALPIPLPGGERDIFSVEPETAPPAEPPVNAEVGRAVPTTEAILEESKEAPAEQGKEEAAKEVVEAITFLLDKEEYALDIRLVKEIIKPRELTDVPRAPKDIMGVISLRGAVIPIMNLRGRLGMPMKEGFERIIIVRDGASLLGLIVDNVKQVVRVPKNNIEPPPSVNTIDGEFIRGIGRYKGEMFILLELEKILESM